MGSSRTCAPVKGISCFLWTEYCGSKTFRCTQVEVLGGSVICTTAEGKWGLYRTVPTPQGMASLGSNHSYLTHCIGPNCKYTIVI
jgi:hypothetical protein